MTFFSSSPEDAFSSSSQEPEPAFLGLHRLLNDASASSEQPFDSLWAKLDAALDADAKQESSFEAVIFDDETLSTYLDGLLSKEETSLLEQQLSSQPHLAERVGGLLDLQQKLRHYWVSAEDNCRFDVTQQVMLRLEQEETLPVRQQPNWLELEQASALLDDEGTKPDAMFGLQTQQFQQQAILLRQALSDYWLRYEERLAPAYFSEAQVQTLVTQAGPTLNLLTNSDKEAKTKPKSATAKRPWRWWSHVAASLLGVVLAGLLNNMPLFKQNLPFAQQGLDTANGASFDTGTGAQLSSAWPFIQQASSPKVPSASLQQASSRQLEPLLPSIKEPTTWPELDAAIDTPSVKGKHLACCQQNTPSSEEYWLNNSEKPNSDDEILLLLNL
jgi:hypothetical protein